MIMSPSEREAILGKAREICGRYTEGITVAEPLVLTNGLGVCLHVPNQQALDSASLKSIIQQIERIPGVERVFAEV